MLVRTRCVATRRSGRSYVVMSPVTGWWLRAGRVSLSKVLLSRGSIQTSLTVADRRVGLVVPR